MKAARDRNSAERSYWRAFALAAFIGTALSWGAVTADADAEHKAHRKIGGQTAAKTAASVSPAETSDPAPASVAPKPAQADPKPAETWSEVEIADARAHCAVILQRIHAVALPHAPIREGACGAPAPVELISIGRNPQVALSPPAIVRCDLAEQLVNWFEKDVQPLARKHLKSAIVRIETMSSYSCRNAYGRKSAKLSEHALANAVDIGGFITASAKSAEVLDDWGKPEREVVAEAAAQKLAAEEAAAKTAQADVAGNPAHGALPSAAPSTAGAAAVGLVRSTIIDGISNHTSAVPDWAPGTNVNRLGGPPAKPVNIGSAARKAAFLSFGGGRSLDNPDPAMRAFLHEAHETACQVFGTTLGPEANAAHRNHFHVDMASRKFGKICD